VTSNGFGDPQRDNFWGMESYGGALYLGVVRGDAAGGELLRSTDGINFSRSAGGGFNDPVHTRIEPVMVFNNALFASTNGGVTTLWALGLPPANLGVTFTDSALEAAIRTRLGIPQPMPVTQEAMLGLTDLTAEGLGIKSLEGLQYAHNLRNLNLYENEITDVSPLASLNQLSWVALAGNQITDVSPLSGITSLRTLWLGVTLYPNEPGELNLGNQISDLSPLAGLTGLQSLGFSHNPVSDLSPIAGLTNVSYLSASDCDITSVASLAGWTKLSILRLGENRISDITPLGNCPLLADVILRDNRIADISPIAGFTGYTKLRIDGNLITDISALASNPGFESGDELNVSNNYLDIADGTPTKGVVDQLLAQGVTVTYAPQNTQPGDIPTGTDVSVTVGQATVIFSEVTSGGTLRVTPYAPRRTGPSNFRLLPNIYFDIHPTALFTGPATVILRIPDDYSKDLTRLKVFHWTDGAWETISPTVDVDARTLTFQTDSFSDFGVGEPTAEEVSTPASSDWSLALFAGCVLALLPVMRRKRLGTR